MFQLTLLDHLRLTFGHVVHRHKAHVQSAERLARRVWQIRIVELTLLGGTVAASVAAVLQGGGRLATLAAVLASASFLSYALTLAFRLELRIYAHQWCGARLWLIREKYAALLAELSDGVIDIDAARQRRDALMNELHSVYEHAPLLDRATYQSAKQALATSEEAALADEEIDRFLPKSLRKTARPDMAADARPAAAAR